MRRQQIWMRFIGAISFFLVFFSMPPPGCFAQLPAPPMLLSPENEQVIVTANPAFFWTPAQAVAGTRLFYKFRIAHLMPNQKPEDAIKGNKPHHEKAMRRQGYQYPENGLPFDQGESYAWAVQVIDNKGNAQAKNEGWTEVRTFNVKSISEPPASPEFEPVFITTEKFSVTGIRFHPVSMTINPLAVTGIRFSPITLQTGSLTVTGIRFHHVSMTTTPLTVTGIRFNPITLQTSRLTVTGIREQTSAEEINKRNEELPVIPIAKKIIEKLIKNDEESDTLKTKSD